MSHLFIDAAALSFLVCLVVAMLLLLLLLRLGPLCESFHLRTSFMSALKDWSPRELKRIDLWRSRIGDEEANALALALVSGSFPQLVHIDLYGNFIGPEGAEALAGALERGSFPSLVRIDLHWNELGEDGLMALALALERASLPALRDIFLRSNGVPDDDDVFRRLRRAITCACQRGRLLLLLGAERARRETPLKRFLARDGDHAVLWRTLRFMLPCDYSAPGILR